MGEVMNRLLEKEAASSSTTEILGEVEDVSEGEREEEVSPLDEEDEELALELEEILKTCSKAEKKPRSVLPKASDAGMKIAMKC